MSLARIAARSRSDVTAAAIDERVDESPGADRLGHDSETFEIDRSSYARFLVALGAGGGGCSRVGDGDGDGDDDGGGSGDARGKVVQQMLSRECAAV
jgi:hypothetical protein